MKKAFSSVLTASVICTLFAFSACAQEERKGPGLRSEVVPVRHFKAPREYRFDPKELPAPFATKSARRSSRMTERPEGAALELPEGFGVSVFAEGDMRSPRMLAQASNGDVFVSDSFSNRILVLRDTDGDGRADKRFLFTDKAVQPFGLVFFKDWLYVANTNSVVRYTYKAGQTEAAGEPQKVVDLPGQGYRQHWTRNIAVSPDGTKLFVTVGSESNVDVEADPRRAAISVYDTDGGNHRIFASGLRNAIGIDFNPVNGELWTAVNERDGLGDDLVPDYVTSVRDGGFYGWPYVYIGKNIDPRRKDDVKQSHLESVLVPDVLVESHSAALGLVFYKGNMFPKEYRGDAFVAFHGSWNRQKLTGFKVVRIRFGKDGKPIANGYEDFLTGWLPDPESTDVWGRPVGLLVLKDGSLLVTDDGANKIWRITYRK